MNVKVSGQTPISVLLPVFMREQSDETIRLMRRALESVYDQPLPSESEIIIVDDGSPSPVQNLSDYLGSAGRSACWIRFDRNRGLVAALNAGLRLARHTLIARIDADDAWLPTKLNVQLARFAEDPDLTIIGTGMARVTPAGEVIDTHLRSDGWTPILRFLRDVGCPFPHGSIVGRRDIFQILGGYPFSAAFSHCEDYALWADWLRFFKPGMIEAALFEYTVSEGAVSQTHAAQQANASKQVKQRLAFLHTDLPDAMSALSQCLGIASVEAGVVAYRMWRFGAAVRLPAEAIDPLQRILPDRFVERARSSNALTLRELLHDRSSAPAAFSNEAPVTAYAASH